MRAVENQPIWCGSASATRTSALPDASGTRSSAISSLFSASPATSNTSGAELGEQLVDDPQVRIGFPFEGALRSE